MKKRGKTNQPQLYDAIDGYKHNFFFFSVKSLNMNRNEMNERKSGIIFKLKMG